MTAVDGSLDALARRSFEREARAAERRLDEEILRAWSRSTLENLERQMSH